MKYTCAYTLLQESRSTALMRCAGTLLQGSCSIADMRCACTLLWEFCSIADMRCMFTLLQRSCSIADIEGMTAVFCSALRGQSSAPAPEPLQEGKKRTSSYEDGRRRTRPQHPSDRTIPSDPFTVIKDLHLFSRKLILKRMHYRREADDGIFDREEQQAIEILESLMEENTPTLHLL
ncbi:uncharacterized protein [Dendrobates tinctorius]|uniref:uncharacterized protein n=1 Tax=Dendrobates tinctorius TaxID=92724 RepID=UPI003CC927A8